MRRGAGFERRVAVGGAAGGHLRVVGVDEAPAVARALAGVGEVLVVGRQLDLEALVEHDVAVGLIDAQPARVAAVDLGEPLQMVLDRDLAAGRGVPAGERGDLGGDVDVAGVRGGEDAAVRGLDVGDLQHLLGPEVGEVDHPDPPVRAIVDVDPAPVVVAVGFRQRRMVAVAPAQRLAVVRRHASGRERRLRPVGAVAVPLPRLRREDGDGLEQAHRGDAEGQDLSGVSARREQHVVVVLAGRDERLERVRRVLRGQSTLGRDRHQIPGGSSRTGAGQQLRDGNAGRGHHGEADKAAGSALPAGLESRVRHRYLPSGRTVRRRCTPADTLVDGR